MPDIFKFPYIKTLDLELELKNILIFIMNKIKDITINLHLLIAITNQ
ncbi:hypothetical protein SEHO0A_04597 [Salmonella enterica subsp. houtenae str. ATCC BAA-1581]|nr:hypothetical protein SEHO0A_04597 [Salmonella enterica subsp. houtenae str. ATCC BAA-1581]ENZ84177.1 hypothetical protein D088_790074 [Salmonella enterica subsp. houtenae serovar 16:z4,z32:-- str. RKS3027]